ncbi:MAG: hypothetical protein KAR07_08780, partial [Spirochaetes bacterium]|nr:hypothetical protein [Spirochaetota bacterium]
MVPKRLEVDSPDRVVKTLHATSLKNTYTFPVKFNILIRFTMINNLLYFGFFMKKIILINKKLILALTFMLLLSADLFSADL